MTEALTLIAARTLKNSYGTISDKEIDALLKKMLYM
jgi:hypothetical protein